MANIIFHEESGVADSIFGKSQFPIYAFIEQRAEAFEQNSIWRKLFKEMKSNKWGERITGMTAMTGPEPVGEAGLAPTDGFQEGFHKDIVHVSWRDSFSITREMMDDANMMDLKKRPQAFMTAYERKMELFAAAMFGNAIQGNSSMTFSGMKFDLTTSDNVGLFNASHPSKLDSSFTQSNICSNTISAENIGLMETHQQMFADDDGNLLNLAPTTILIPNDNGMKNAVWEAIGSDKNPINANNAMNYQYGRWNIIVWSYLNKYMTGENKPWIMIDPQYLEDYDASVWFNRTGVEVNSYIDHSTLANVWQMYFRFGAGFTDWRAFQLGGIANASALT